MYIVNSGLCIWVQEDSDDLDWTHSSGHQAEEPWDGPEYDHTMGNDQGWYSMEYKSNMSSGCGPQSVTISVSWFAFIFYQGMFLVLNGSASISRQRAIISVPVITQAPHICVGFWYYMLGPSVSNLDLLVQTVCLCTDIFMWIICANLFYCTFLDLQYK